MKDSEQIVALLEWDGWYQDTQGMFVRAAMFVRVRNVASVTGIEHKCLDEFKYLTSLDAIMPLVRKALTKLTCHSFFDALGIIRAKDTADCDGQYEYQGDGSYYEMWLVYTATPSQIAEAILRTLGLWKE